MGDRYGFKATFNRTFPVEGSNGYWSSARDSFESMFNQAFPMEAVIQRHMDDRRMW